MIDPTPPAPIIPRILVVDDNPAIHADFRKIFGEGDGTAGKVGVAEAALFDDNVTVVASSRFDLDDATQGQEALAKVRQALAEGRPYAMAFMDVRMPPGWDGIETTQKLWEAYPDIQIVICTAYSDYSWEDMIAKLGQSDRLVILKKPFDNVEVLQLVHSLTEKWRLLQLSRAQVAGLQSDVHARAAELEQSNMKLRAEIAERRRGEEERQKIEVQLRSAQKLESIGQLAAGVAHEINTPTQFIGDNLRFVRDSFTDLLALQPVEQRLLEAARTGAIPPGLAEEGAVARKKADVDYLAGEIPKALAQALEGVERVSTIVRAMKEFSHPGVSEKQKIGLNHAIENTITVSRNEWKYVADLTTKGVGKGTGQGLAIAHNVVVGRHGGTLVFETEMGRGTTFVIRLPIDPVVAKSTECKAA